MEEKLQRQVDYGSVDYWNSRYSDKDMGGAFDWLFEFCDVKDILSQLIQKDRHIVVSCSSISLVPC